MTNREAAPGFSDPDLSAWIGALRVLPTAPVTEADVLAWVEGPLLTFFTFERFLGAYGNLSGGRIQMRSLVSSGHAGEFLTGLETTFGLISRIRLAHPADDHTEAPFSGSQNRWNLFRRHIDSYVPYQQGVGGNNPGGSIYSYRASQQTPPVLSSATPFVPTLKDARIRAALGGRIVSGEACAHPALAELITPRSPPWRYPQSHCFRRTPSA